MRQTNLTMHRKRVAAVRKLLRTGLTVAKASKKMKIVPSQFYVSVEKIKHAKKTKKTRH